MTWVQIQKAEQATWDDYAPVARLLGDTAPDGLMVHAAGEVDGLWRSVSIWESKEAFERFRNERLLPVVAQVHGDEVVGAGPPPSEWFEVKHLLQA